MDLIKTTDMQTKHFRYFDRIATTEEISHIDFCLHSHEHYEIYLFLEGDSNYIIEDKSYPLKPYDLFVIKKNEFHQVLHNTHVPYHRIFIWIDSLFFQKYNCTKYEEKFLNVSPDSGSKIPANVVRSSGIYDVFMRIKKYTDQYKDMTTPVLEPLIVELLHLIHHSSPLVTVKYIDNSIQPVISYLNQNFTQNITLDMLQEMFFVSKYHLCRKFRESTGMSIHEYIRKKRLAKAREFKTEGGNLADIAMEVGFSDYSTFYRAYQKEYGCTPKED